MEISLNLTNFMWVCEACANYGICSAEECTVILLLLLHCGISKKHIALNDWFRVRPCARCSCIRNQKLWGTASYIITLSTDVSPEEGCPKGQRQQKAAQMNGWDMMKRNNHNYIALPRCLPFKSFRDNVAVKSAPPKSEALFHVQFSLPVAHVLLSIFPIN